MLDGPIEYIFISFVSARRSWQRARHPSDPCPKAGPLTSQATRSSAASYPPKSPVLARHVQTTVSRVSPKVLSRTLRRHEQARRGITPPQPCASGNARQE